MKKFLLTALTIFTILYFSLMWVNGSVNKSKTISKVGSHRISQNDIKAKFLQIFNNSSDNGNFDIKTLPIEAIKSLSKEVYLERELLKSAKKARVHKDPGVEDKILRSVNSIIIESYLAQLIELNTTEEKINNKYLQIVTDLKGKREYSLATITLKNEELAKTVFKKINSAKDRFLNYRFGIFYNKYATKVDQRNKKSFVPQALIPQNVLSDFENGKRLSTSGLYIYKLIGSREATIPKLTEQYKVQIRGLLTKEVMQRFIKKNLKDKKVVILDYK